MRIKTDFNAVLAMLWITVACGAHGQTVELAPRAERGFQKVILSDDKIYVLQGPGASGGDVTLLSGDTVKEGENVLKVTAVIPGPVFSGKTMRYDVAGKYLYITSQVSDGNVNMRRVLLDDLAEANRGGKTFKDILVTQDGSWLVPAKPLDPLNNARLDEEKIQGAHEEVHFDFTAGTDDVLTLYVLRRNALTVWAGKYHNDKDPGDSAWEKVSTYQTDYTGRFRIVEQGSAFFVVAEDRMVYTPQGAKLTRMGDLGEVPDDDQFLIVDKDNGTAFSVDRGEVSRISGNTERNVLHMGAITREKLAMPGVSTLARMLAAAAGK